MTWRSDGARVARGETLSTDVAAYTLLSLRTAAARARLRSSRCIRTRSPTKRAFPTPLDAFPPHRRRHVRSPPRPAHRRAGDRLPRQADDRRRPRLRQLGSRRERARRRRLDARRTLRRDPRPARGLPANGRHEVSRPRSERLRAPRERLLRSQGAHLPPDGRRHFAQVIFTPGASACCRARCETPTSSSPFCPASRRCAAQFEDRVARLNKLVLNGWDDRDEDGTIGLAVRVRPCRPRARRPAARAAVVCRWPSERPLGRDPVRSPTRPTRATAGRASSPRSRTRLRARNLGGRSSGGAGRARSRSPHAAGGGDARPAVTTASVSLLSRRRFASASPARRRQPLRAALQTHSGPSQRPEARALRRAPRRRQRQYPRSSRPTRSSTSICWAKRAPAGRREHVTNRRSRRGCSRSIARATLYVTGERSGRLYAIDAASGARVRRRGCSEPIGVWCGRDDAHSSWRARRRRDRRGSYPLAAATLERCDATVPSARKPWSLAWGADGSTLLATHLLGPGVSSLRDAAAVAGGHARAGWPTEPPVPVRRDPHRSAWLGARPLRRGGTPGLGRALGRPPDARHRHAQPTLDFQRTVFPALSIFDDAAPRSRASRSRQTPAIRARSVTWSPGRARSSSPTTAACVRRRRRQRGRAVVDAAQRIEATACGPSPGTCPRAWCGRTASSTCRSATARTSQPSA